MCPETFPAEAKSVRLFVIHDDLKPPQTTGRRADLEMGAHRRLCRTEIPATGNSMLLKITDLFAELPPPASCLLLEHESLKGNRVFSLLLFLFGV